MVGPNCDPSATRDADSFGSAAGQVSYANGVVSINTDTDAAAEYAIKLVGTVPATLTADNFVL